MNPRRVVSPDKPITHKRCSMCRKHQVIAHFGVCRTNWDGYQNYCKVCIRVYKSSRKAHWPQCKKCERRYPLMDQYWIAQRGSETGLYIDMCKACLRHPQGSRGRVWRDRDAHYADYYSAQRSV